MVWRVVLSSSGAVMAAFGPPRAKERAEAERDHLVEKHGYAMEELEVVEASDTPAEEA